MVRCSTFNSVDGLLESIKALKSLPLLHFGMELKVFNFEEVKQTIESSCGGNGIAENDMGLTLLLLQEIIQVQILFLYLAPHKVFLKC